MSAEKQNFLLPIIIIIIGFIIAGALVYFKDKPSDVLKEVKRADDTISIRPVSNQDHISGNQDALVKLVEFSDLECPYCKRFHPIMQRIISEYGPSKELSWIYRHFPIDSLHSRARTEAQATECANELGGNNAFWDYVNRLFELTPSNDGLNLSLLPRIAQEIGLDVDEFSQCLASDKYSQRIEEDYQEAIAIGAKGTPYSVVIAPNGKKFPINGAQSYSAVRAIIELALKEK